MLDSLLHRHLEGSLTRVSARAAELPLGPLGLIAAAFVCGVAAMAAIGYQAYLVGLVFLLTARGLEVVEAEVARQKAPAVLRPYLAHLLSTLVGAGIPFAFALSQPGHALAAMFLIFGLLVRSAAIDATVRLAVPDPVIGYFGRVGRLVEKTDLCVAFALACIFPDWFSVIAYTFGILCFISAGGRAAAVAVHEP